MQKTNAKKVEFSVQQLFESLKYTSVLTVLRVLVFVCLFVF